MGDFLLLERSKGKPLLSMCWELLVISLLQIMGHYWQGDLFFYILNEFCNTLIELFRFFPEQHMAAVLKDYSLGTGDVFPDPGTSVYIEDLAFPGAADQGGDVDMGQEIPPVQVGVVPHDFNPHIGRAFADFIHQHIAVFC